MQSRHPVNKKRSRLSNIYVIMISILIIILLCVIVFIYWLNFMQQPKESDNKVSPSSAVSVGMNADIIIENVYSIVKDKKYTYDTIKSDTDFNTTGSPIYKPIDAEYYVYASKGAALIVYDSDSSHFITDFAYGGTSGDVKSKENQYAIMYISTMSDIKSYFANHKFEKYEHGYYDDAVVVKDFMTYYISSNVICSLDIASFRLELNCSNIADYRTTLSAVAPFDRTLRNTITDNVGEAIKANSASLAYRMPMIKNSLTPGYKTANLYVTTNSYGMNIWLYKKENANWVYFSQPQSEQSCDEFDTVELRAAFKGDECYNIANNKQSVVN